MATSKLFTPKLRAAQATPINEVERAPMFVNPPTHPEVPTFAGNTDEGKPCYPLSLGGDRGTSTREAQKRPISTCPQEQAKY